jgi:hypothetical protein
MITFLHSLLFLLGAPAQQPTTQNPADLCTIQSVVIKAGTGEPLHKGIVEVFLENGHSGPCGPSTTSAVLSTDRQYHFRLTPTSRATTFLHARRAGAKPH